MLPFAESLINFDNLNGVGSRRKLSELKLVCARFPSVVLAVTNLFDTESLAL